MLFQLTSGKGLRQPSRPCPLWHSSTHLSNHGTVCLEWPAKGCPRMDEVLHPLPDNQGESPQQSTLWHLRCSDARFHHVHINPVGPLSPPQGHRFLLTSVGRFTRWREAIPLTGWHTDTVILASLQNLDCSI